MKSIKNILPLWKKMMIKAHFSSGSVNLWNEENGNEKYIYLLDLPGHNNLGDEAIAISEVQFIEKYAKKYGYKLITTTCYDNLPLVAKHIKKRITPQDIIMLHGGGNMGDLYPYYENIRMFLIRYFHNNKIFIFPQTYFVRKKDKLIDTMKKIYNSHNNLYIFAREKNSFNKMKEDFPNAKIILSPDMVLTYKFSKDVKKEKKVATFCLRNDDEKINNDDYYLKIREYIKEKGYQIYDTNTVMPNGITYNDVDEAKVDVDNKIEELGKSEIVVTDRLHGMVLSILGGANCLALDNNSKKVSGVINSWLKTESSVKIFDPENFKNQIDELIDNEKKFDIKKFDNERDRMAQIIFKSMVDD